MATTATVSAPGYGSALMNAVRSFALLRESVVGMAGTALVLFWATLAIGAPLFAPCDPQRDAAGIRQARHADPHRRRLLDRYVRPGRGQHRAGHSLAHRVGGTHGTDVGADCGGVRLCGGDRARARGGVLPRLDRRPALRLREHHPRLSGAGPLHPDHRHHRRFPAEHRVRGHICDGAAGDAHRARPGARPAQTASTSRQPRPAASRPGASCSSRSCRTLGAR